jgi:hypothetical protein
MSRVGQWPTYGREERWQRDARYVAACLKTASPEPDQPPATWRQTVKQWAGTRGRQVQRIAVQGYQRAVQAGRARPRGVLYAIQQAAHPPEHLMRRPARSVEIREAARRPDTVFARSNLDNSRGVSTTFPRRLGARHHQERYPAVIRVRRALAGQASSFCALLAISREFKQKPT